LTSVLRRAANASESLRAVVVAEGVLSSATSRVRRTDRVLADRGSDGLDQLLGGLACGGQERRRVAALPQHDADRGRPPACGRHVDEERKAPSGGGVRAGLAGVALGDQAVEVGSVPATGSVTSAIKTI
jgi:hypothetical protein